MVVMNIIIIISQSMSGYTDDIYTGSNDH